VKNISISEITEFLNERREFKQATVRSEAIELKRASILSPMGRTIGKVSSRNKNLAKKPVLAGTIAKALATLRIYNNYEFFIQETDLKHIDTLQQQPQIENFTFKVLNTPKELDELINDGFDIQMNFSKIKRELKKGMVVFLVFIDKELASIGWACMTENSKTTFKGYPFNDDLDRLACIVGEWTNPKYQNGEISSFITHKRQQLLKEKGFTLERSIVEKGIVKELHNMSTQKRFEFNYKRRTYINVSLPGILGLELWNEHQLNKIDTNPPYRMITILGLVLPSPPRIADLAIKPKVKN
jgi:hypothetical protein